MPAGVSPDGGPTLDFIVGIFVGGRARRMGGIAKGLLDAPDFRGTLIDRTRAIIREALPNAELVLTGANPDYARVHLPVLADTTPDKGPLGGLTALLAHAATSKRHVIAIACDMPFLTPGLLTRVAFTAPDQPIVMPIAQGHPQPLCARYDPERVLPAARDALQSENLSLRALIAPFNPVELVLMPEEERALTDWDTPEDVARSGQREG